MIPDKKPIAKSSRKAAVVLGVHGSGANALAQALAPWNFASAIPAARTAPKGVAALNLEILGWLGARWDRPGPFLAANRSLRASASLIDALVWRRWADVAADALQADFAASGDFVVSDRQMLPLLPFWDAALRAFGAEPRYLLVYRHPLEVVASLRARGEIGLRQALQLWQIGHDAVFAFAAQQQLGAVLNYAELLEKPAPALRRVLGSLGAAPGESAFQAAASRLDPNARHHKSGPAALRNFVHMPPLVRDTYEMLTDWSAHGGEPPARRMYALAARFEDAAMLTGPVVPVTPVKLAFPEPLEEDMIEQLAQAPKAPQPAPEKPAPLLVMHYHLFKNAGTSVDDMLRHNFGTRWGHAEFGPPPPGRNTNAEAVADYLAERPELLAFSSHTSLLPLPEIGREIFPILFIRHPIDRLKSAYSFERKQVAETYGAQLAKANDFAGYLRALLADLRQRQARNFQTSRIACNEPRERGTELERALRTLALLPFVGLVEDYEGSLQRLQTLLRPLVPGFEIVVVHANRTHEKPEPLSAKLAAIRANIGDALFDELTQANLDDIELFKWAAARNGYAA